MQTFVSIIDRKTNVQICSATIDLRDSELSPTNIFNYIWENAVDNGMIVGDRNDYLIQLFNQQNHIIDLYEYNDLIRIKKYEKNGGIKGKVVCLHSYKEYRNYKISKAAANFGSIH